MVEHHIPVWEGREQKWRAGAPDAVRLSLAQLRLLRRPRRPFDALVVGYPGHADLATARHAAGGRPILFSPLVSLWDTFVEDRGRFRPGSAASRALLAVDRRALRAADMVVADTHANASYLRRLADLPVRGVRVCFVGAEERLFAPPWRPSGPPLFVGKLIPLHGVETILAAARRLRGRAIRVVGTGQLDRLLAQRPANVEWAPWIDYERLPAAFRGAACALGVFGTSRKASRVIPNKVFQALACGTPVVTGDTPAARELLVHEESALLVPPGDPVALAEAVERLCTDPRLAVQIARGGHAAYRTHAAEAVLGARWRALVEELV